MLQKFGIRIFKKILEFSITVRYTVVILEDDRLGARQHEPGSMY